MINFNFYVKNADFNHTQMEEIRKYFKSLKDTIMVKAAETAQTLRDTNDRMIKALGEIRSQIAALEEAARDPDTPEDVNTAVAALVASAQVLDDLNPDVVNPPPVDPTDPPVA